MLGTGFGFGSLGGAAGTAGATYGTATNTTAAAAVPAAGGFTFGSTLGAVDNQQQKSVRFDVPGATATSQATAPTLSSLLSGNTSAATPLTGLCIHCYSADRSVYSLMLCTMSYT